MQRNVISTCDHREYRTETSRRFLEITGFVVAHLWPTVCMNVYCRFVNSLSLFTGSDVMYVQFPMNSVVYTCELYTVLSL